ncbi:EamA family transporter [Paraburkholderia sp.]|uniref:EamA family transporter n=1 Tax=Paraburkholderia sp. TaxID=1926495 RepID=UPI00286F54BB|nr:EamA family transporter [Paraburkholderia sp.]
MQRKHLILAVFVTAIWGLNFPITKLGLAQINPLLLTAIRFTFAAFPWVFLVRKPNVANRWLAAYGLIFGVAMWALINLGISMGVPPGDASLLIQFSAFFTLGWGVMLFREKLMASQMTGIVMAAGGLIGILHGSPGKATTIGFALVMVSALAWSIGNVVIKISKVREIFAFVVWASLIPPIPLFLLTWCLYGTQPFAALASHVSAVALFSLAFQVYAATHFCYWGWNLLLREYPASTVAPLSLLIPVFGTLSSISIVHQVPNTASWISIALILSALLIILGKRRPGPGSGSEGLDSTSPECSIPPERFPRRTP